MTMDFSWVRSKAGLLSSTSTPAAVREMRHLAVLFFAVAALGVEHDADVYAALMGGDDGIKQRGVGEDEHLDAHRFLLRR